MTSNWRSDAMNVGLPPQLPDNPVQACYMTWPLEKLRREYRILILKEIATSMENSALKEELAVFKNFMEAFEELLDHRERKKDELR